VIRAARALVCIGLAAAACAPRTQDNAAGEPHHLDGVINLVIGDPAPPARTGTTLATLSLTDGRSWQVVPDTAAGVTDLDLRRFDGARVRVTARFVAGDSTLIRVQRIDSLPPAR
jgi:hypothetical protein